MSGSPYPLVAFTGIITATIIGFIVGIGRLSNNWLIAKLSQVYVEAFRNIPPLLVIFFWYKGVLAVLPQPRDSVHLPFSMYLNNRGLAFPRPVWGDGTWAIPVALVSASWPHRRLQMGARPPGADWPPFPSGWTGFGLIAGYRYSHSLRLARRSPSIIRLPASSTSPAARSWAGIRLPLSGALLLHGGLHRRNRAVRHQGGREGPDRSCICIGLQPGVTTRTIVIPQALRIIIPPLTSQYLNLTKNSSLAIAIGFSDLVSVGGTILNQTGRAVEIVAIWMVVYLSISLATSLFMNWFQRPHGSGRDKMVDMSSHYLRAQMLAPEAPPTSTSGDRALGTHQSVRHPEGCSADHHRFAGAGMAGARCDQLAVHQGSLDGRRPHGLRHDRTAGRHSACRLVGCLLGVRPVALQHVHLRTLSDGGTLAANPGRHHADRPAGADADPQGATQGANAVLLFIVFPVVAFYLLLGGVFGLSHVETTANWGGLMVTLILSFVGIAVRCRRAFCWRSAGARRCR